MTSLRLRGFRRQDSSLGTDVPKIPKVILDQIKAVTNKRARFVLDSIVRNGVVTTEEINNAGYEHPPRAARDVRELGFPLKTIKVKHTNGRSIAAYKFDEGELQAGKIGRCVLPKKLRDEIIHSADQVLCGSCNRKKSWDCEHCQNWLHEKNPDVCRHCYWAEPTGYTHVAMHQQRRAELVWIGDEVRDFDRLKGDAERNGISVPQHIKHILKKD